ncbi:protein SIEVE ELEMENT OCCLUSION B-like isoform X1 [Chenopodium quinoa]|uniref:Protein SIEVE ELEMENT OCCLUSION B-like n=1 Tax=Chenopodium quinoa TaxID=63459 RepID=A0A803N782_CHEQI|nr:protein SIEVE ELEMENT OCCLUSION B-like isoform X1 [Chenopodium quinoa]
MANNPLTSNLSTPLSSSLTPASRTAADQRGVYLPSDDARSQLPRSVADQRGMYLPSDDARSQLPRGAAAEPRGMYLPSDDRRSLVAPPRGTERVGKSALPYDDGSRLPLTAYDQGGRLPLSSKGTDLGLALVPSDNLGRPLLPRGTEHGMRYPSDRHEPLGLLSRGTERGGIFLTSDDHSLVRQVELLHFPDARNVDVRPLLRLVEDIIDRSTQAVEGESLQGTIISKREASLDGKYTLNGLQEVPELPLIVERISCEMTCKVLSGVDAHNTTLAVLNMLQHFSWEAKVVLTLAAFALTYGDFWLLVQIYSTNALGKAMALIKRLPMVMEKGGAFRHQFDATNNLIKAMLETTRCIVEFGELPSTYISPEDPEVKAAIHHFPIAVYWIVRSAAAAATHITTLSSRGLEHGAATSESWELSNWAHKLKTISEHLRETLSRVYQLIREKRDIDAYNMIKKIIYETIHVDNMKVLNVLIYAENEDPQLFDGPSKTRVHLEVLRRKNVLLLISDLDIKPGELFMLEQSYTDSKVHSYDIVWIPVVDHPHQWTDAMHAKFENLKTSMPWYSVHHPSMIGSAVIKFIREDWHFRGRPILVVLDPLGKVVSPNAIHMMWIWQSQAFPFTSIREENLWAQETWRLELLVNGIDSKILDWIREDKYIFVYGGDDLEWIRKFTREAHAVARALQVSVEMVYVGRSHNEKLVRRVMDAILTEQLSHCWQDLTFVWYFWTRIECMIYSKIQLGKVHDHGDNILQEVQRLHSHDKSHGGWAILAKGSKIIVHGHGKLTLVTLQELELWKKKAEEEGFHLGFGYHYNELHRKEFPCHKIEFPSNVKVPKSMLCPDCRRHMKSYHSFICCHEDYGVGPEFVPGVPYEG